jgi:hypothetical protein
MTQYLALRLMTIPSGERFVLKTQVPGKILVFLG